MESHCQVFCKLAACCCKMLKTVSSKPFPADKCKSYLVVIVVIFHILLILMCVNVWMKTFSDIFFQSESLHVFVQTL